METFIYFKNSFAGRKKGFFYPCTNQKQTEFWVEPSLVAVMTRDYSAANTASI